VLRLDRDPGKEFAGLVRHAIYEFDPRLIATQVSSIEEIISDQMWAERQAFTILKGLSVIALALAVVGLFSVIAYTVDSRAKEFGVRMALGATPAGIFKMVVGRGLFLSAVGVAGGFMAALALTRAMRSMLVGVTATDPATFAAMIGLFFLIAAVASWAPARRAAALDPATTLRLQRTGRWPSTAAPRAAGSEWH